MLTPAEKDRFRKDGYLHLRGLLGADEVEQLRAWASELARGADEPGGVMRYYEEELKRAGRLALSRVEYFRPHHAGLRQVTEGGRVPAVAGELLGEPALLFKDKINFKTPGGAPFEPHQDAQAGWLDYCAFQLTCLVALDEARLENGCLELAAGHHEKGLLGERGRPLGGASLEGIDFTPCETRPGDAVFFGCFVPHRSGPNTTDRERRVLYLTYNARSLGDHYQAYFADKRRSFPPDWERDPAREYRYRV